MTTDESDSANSLGIRLDATRNLTSSSRISNNELIQMEDSVLRWFHVFLFVLFLSMGCDRDLQVPVVSEGTSAPAVDANDFTVEYEIESTAKTEPSDDSPAVWSISIDQDQAMPGESVTLTVKCDVHPDWHIYSIKGPTGVARPTKLDLRLPKSVTKESDWRLPKDTTVVGYKGPESRYTDEIVFSVTLKVDDKASPASAHLRCEVHYQACTESACLPPTLEVLEVRFDILTAKES